MSARRELTVSFLLSLISLVQATLIPWLYHVQWNVQCYPWKLRVHSYQEGPRKFSGYCGRRSWGGIWCPPRNLFLDSEAKERIHKTCFENWVTSLLRKINNFKIWTKWTITGKLAIQKCLTMQWNLAIWPPCLNNHLVICMTIFFQPRHKNHWVILLSYGPC